MNAVTSQRTALIISPSEYHYHGHINDLPHHLNVIPSFMTEVEQVDVLARNLAAPLFQTEFKITSLESKQQGNQIVQRIGGSALHNLHDEAIGVLDDMGIEHSGERWREGSDRTWYKGTWKVPSILTAVNRVLLVQKERSAKGWQLIHEYKLSKPNVDFRPDLNTQRYKDLIGDYKR